MKPGYKKHKKMATYKQGILGGFSGRIGNVVGTFWKGRQVMRIRAASVNDANTPRQQEQRMRFKLVNSFLSANKELIDWGFGAYDRTMTPMNAAVSYNIRTAVSGTFPALTIDPSTVMISRGTLAGFDDGVITSTVAHTIDFDWLDNTPDSNAFGTDNLMVSVVDNASREVIQIPMAAKRADEELSLTLPPAWSGRTVTVYTFFVSESGSTNVSDASQVSNTEKVLSLTII